MGKEDMGGMKTATGKKFKRILACLLSVSMLASMVPVSLAQGAAAEQIVSTEESTQNAVSDSDEAALSTIESNVSQTQTLAL